MDSYDRRLTQTVTLKLRSAGSEDDHGIPAEVITEEDHPGFISRQTASEAEAGSIVAEQFRLFLRAGVPLTGWDAVEVDEASYEVIGHPWEVFNPRTAEVHHVEADIKRAGTDG